MADRQNQAERRTARRFVMCLPLMVKFQGAEGLREHPGETRDVSFRGLYFVSEGQFEPGAAIEFVLTLPQKITLAGDVHIRCFARVVRAEAYDLRQGVAARIERYEFLPSAA